MIVIACGHVGLNMVKNNCENVDVIHPQRQFWDNEDSVIRNEKILAVTTGIGYGIFLFMLINGIDSILKTDSACGSSTYGFLLMFAIFLICVSSFLIHQNKSTDSACDRQISKNFNIIYGLLGFGLGVLIYSLLSLLFKDVSSITDTNGTTIDKKGVCKSVIKSIIILVFTSMILITQSVSIVSNSNNCKMEKNLDYDKKTPNTIGWTVASLAGVFILSIIVLMIVNARFGLFAKYCK